MKAIVLMVVGALAGIQAFAEQGITLTCKPWTSNTTYTEPVKVKVINSTHISIKGVILVRDANYTPRSPANVGFGQYLGNTNAASGWSDTGDTQILFNGKVLKFSNLGNTDKFNCQQPL